MNLVQEQFKPRLAPEQTLLSPEAKPGHKPRIIVSLDRSWHNALGITWLAFRQMLRRAGGVVRGIRYGLGPEPEDLQPMAREIMEQGDALLLSGGNDVDPLLYGSTQISGHLNHRRDRFELALIQQARSQQMPILGICRGCQLLNVASGGTLHSIRTDHRKKYFHNLFRVHTVHLDPASQISRSVGRTTLRTRSLHGQAVQQVAPTLRVAGWAPDGTIEAIEATKWEGGWLMGVQWHPEYMFTRRPEHRLIEEFVTRARLWKQR